MPECWCFRACQRSFDATRILREQLRSLNQYKHKEKEIEGQNEDRVHKEEFRK